MPDDRLFSEAARLRELLTTAPSAGPELDRIATDRVDVVSHLEAARGVLHGIERRLEEARRRERQPLKDQRERQTRVVQTWQRRVDALDQRAAEVVIDNGDPDMWLSDHRQDACRLASVERELARRATVRRQEAMRMVVVNPPSYVTADLGPRPLDDLQRQAAWDRAARAMESYRQRFGTLISPDEPYTGLRAGELWALRRKRVDLLRRRLYVEEALKDLTGTRLPEEERGLVFGPTKTHARRAVSIPDAAAQALSEHLSKPAPGGNGPDDLVFTTPTGEPVRHANFYRRHFRPAVVGVKAKPERRVRNGNGWRTVPATPAIPAGLPADKADLRWHDLRHTCAAWLIAAGLHPKAIQAQMGHKSITMTLDRYGHLMPGRDDAVASALDAYRVASLAPVDNVRALPNGTEDRASTPPIVSADAAPATATG